LNYLSPKIIHTRSARIFRFALCLLAGILSPALASTWQDPLSGSEEAAAVAVALGDKLNGSDQSSAAITPDLKTNALLNARQAIASTRQEVLETDASEKSATAAIVLGKEILLVELLYQKQKKNGDTQTAKPRIAEVFLFDYATGQTSRYEIDVNTDDVLREQAVASPHLPLNEREQAVAVSMLESDASAFTEISAEYQQHFGQALQDTDNIEMKVSVWQPAAANTSVAASDCRTQRCALISVFTHNNFSFSIEPVVNLMTKTVHTGVIR